MTTETFKIHPGKIDWVNKQIEKFNRRCLKLNVAPATVEFSTPYYVEEEGEQNRPYSDATLSYTIPVIEGWKLIARFDGFPTEDSLEVFASVVPGETLPAEFHDKHDIHCQHCNINRFRNHSILVQHVETGEFKEVGSTCVKDFFGHDPKGFMLYAGWNWKEVIEGVDDFDGDSYSYNGQWYKTAADGLKDVLTMTAAVIDECGWVPRWKAIEYDKVATSAYVNEQLFPPRKLPHNWVAVVPTDEHEKLAIETIEYFKNIEPDNDYLHNCHKVAKIGLVPSRQFGLAVSMVASYKRTIETKAKSEFKESNWVGNVGDKIEVRVKCLFSKTVESYYGYSTLYVFADKDGNVYKTFYSGSKWEMGKDEYATIKGTVKKHGEYNEKKETMLNRVSASDIKTEEEEHDGTDAFDKLEMELS